MSLPLEIQSDYAVKPLSDEISYSCNRKTEFLREQLEGKTNREFVSLQDLEDVGALTSLNGVDQGRFQKVFWNNRKVEPVSGKLLYTMLASSCIIVGIRSSDLEDQVNSLALAHISDSSQANFVEECLEQVCLEGRKIDIFIIGGIPGNSEDTCESVERVISAFKDTHLDLEVNVIDRHFLTSRQVLGKVENSMYLQGNIVIKIAGFDRNYNFYSILKLELGVPEGYNVQKYIVF